MLRKTFLLVTVTLVMRGLAIPASAEVVVYDNADGAFTWLPSVYGSVPGNYFDPTLPPTQSGEQTQFSLGYDMPYEYTSSDVGDGTFSGVGDIEIAVADPFNVTLALITPARVFGPGEVIGPNADWADIAYHSWSVIFVPTPFYLLGEEPTIGFRTRTDTGDYRYGWIELGPPPPLPAPYYTKYHPTRWAYQTAANTPISVIPEPATISSLLLCLLLVAARRRRVRRLALR